MEVVDLRSVLPKNPDKTFVYKKRDLSAITMVVLHCDDWKTTPQVVAGYDIGPSCHINPGKGCPECTYHWFIESDGKINYCVDVSKISWHAGNFNKKSVGICISYRATDNKQPPPEAQMTSVKNLLTYLCLELGIDPDNIHGHRELLGTGYSIIDGKKKLRKTCPGLLVNLDHLRYTVSKAVQEKLSNEGFYKGKVDGIFGAKSEAALKTYITSRKAG